MKVALKDVLNNIAVEYQKEKEIAKTLGLTVKRGCLEELISQKRAEYGIPADTKIFKGTIRSRIVREIASLNGMGPESPMAEAEPQLVELIVRMGRIRRCLTPTQCLHLANDLIKGTEIERKIIDFKRNLFRNRDYEDVDLGLRYWAGFKKR